MAKYQWDFYEIRNNIKKLNELLSSTKDIEQQQLILDMIEMYQTMISFAHNKKISFKNEIETSLDEIMGQYMEYLIKEDEQLINIILNTYLLIKDFKIKEDIDYIISFSNEELISITNDFLEEVLPSPILKKFKQDILVNKNH
jgi:hypothetical protein